MFRFKITFWDKIWHAAAMYLCTLKMFSDVQKDILVFLAKLKLPSHGDILLFRFIKLLHNCCSFTSLLKKHPNTLEYFQRNQLSSMSKMFHSVFAKKRRNGIRDDQLISRVTEIYGALQNISKDECFPNEDVLIF